MSSLSELLSAVDWKQHSLHVAALSIIFNPSFWNIAARAEYRSHIISKLTFGNRKLACYLLAITIFSLGIIRDLLYERALRDQPIFNPLSTNYFKICGIISFTYGNILVLSSMYALGITGTYLGDYFGILMENRVTKFPFNVTDNPMYYGSTLSFLGSGLFFAKPAGLILTLLVLVMYSIALRFEEPFTAEIYAKRDRERDEKSK